MDSRFSHIEAQYDSMNAKLDLLLELTFKPRSHRSTSSKPQHFHRVPVTQQRADDFVDPHPSSYFVDQSNGHAYAKPPSIKHPHYVNPYLDVKPAPLTTANLSEHTMTVMESTTSETSETFDTASKTAPETASEKTFEMASETASKTASEKTSETALTAATSVEEPTIMVVKAPLLCGGSTKASDTKRAVAFPYKITTKTATRRFHETTSKNARFTSISDVKLHVETPVKSTVNSTVKSTTKPHPQACRTCHTSYPSSNGLHRHLQTSGHALPRSSRRRRLDKPWRKGVDGGTIKEKAF